jgi:ABC-2 type transport system permease protein
MFWHVFYYSIKTTIRDKQLIFWTLFFPVIMATFFGIAFTNISQTADFKAIPMGVVETEKYKEDTRLQDLIDSHSDDEDPMFYLSVFQDEAGAKAALKEKSIQGYIVVDDTIQLAVAGSDINEAIMKQFFDYYLQMTSATERILADDPMYGLGMEEVLGKEIVYVQEEESQTNTPDSALTYYYALIAMTCLYAAFHGIKQVSMVQANQSSEAARVSLSPTNKLKVFFASILSVLVVQFLSILLLLLYMHFVQGVDFGNNIPYILLASAVGCLFGISFGSFVGIVLKTGEGIKTAVIISFTMTMSYFAGLMSSTVKFDTVKNMPFMAYANPANLIADSFYSLYYYNTYDRFFQNVSILLGISIVLIIGVTLIMRRQQYESL